MYKSIWDILGIKATKDITEIKTAFSERSKAVHPEDNPEEFKALQNAYHSAIRYASGSGSTVKIAVKHDEKNKEKPLDNNRDSSVAFEDMSDLLAEKKTFTEFKAELEKIIDQNRISGDEWNKILASQQYLKYSKNDEIVLLINKIRQIRRKKTLKKQTSPSQYLRAGFLIFAFILIVNPLLKLFDKGSQNNNTAVHDYNLNNLYAENLQYSEQEKFFDTVHFTVYLNAAELKDREFQQAVQADIADNIVYEESMATGDLGIEEETYRSLAEQYHNGEIEMDELEAELKKYYPARQEFFMETIKGSLRRAVTQFYEYEKLAGLLEALEINSEEYNELIEIYIAEGETKLNELLEGILNAFLNNY